jgi:phage terminase small subunit
MASKLTPKQEAFAKAYIETGNASEAYRRAGYSTKQSAKAINENASKLLTKVQPRVKELQAAHQKRHEVTVDSLTLMLMEDRVLARQEGEANAAINAVLAIAKLHGLVVDKKNVALDANHKHHHTAEPISESAHWLAKLLGAGADSEAAQSLPH